MINTAKRFGLILLCVMYFSLVSCVRNEFVSQRKIKKNATEMMECVVDRDESRLFSYFNSDMKNKYKETTSEEIHRLFDYIDGKIVSYKYKGEGGGMESKDEGHIYYYECYPQFKFTTDTNQEYTIKFSYHFIWDEHMEYEGINMITIRKGDDRDTKLVIGRNYYNE